MIEKDGETVAGPFAHDELPEPKVCVTREELRRALVAAWSDCMPAAHLNFEEVWRILSTRESVPDDVQASGMYPLDTWDCWGDDEPARFR